jgi:hypothetical protein
MSHISIYPSTHMTWSTIENVYEEDEDSGLILKTATKEM